MEKTNVLKQIPHIVTIGGGGGATQVLRAVAPFAAGRSAVIAVTDTGRSTGVARAIASIPAPGDLRATIAAFAENSAMAQLLQHRFSGAGVPQLEGMAFGNLLIAALAEQLGDFGAAVARVAALAETSIDVMPVSVVDTQLCAELADGSVRVGELEVRGQNKPAITRLFLRDPAPANPAALAAIQAADMVVLGPGSLFTTVLATLQHEGLIAALRETPAQVVYVCNTTTQPGQTDGFSALDHVRQIVAALGPHALDAALINRSSPDQAALRQYEAEGLFLLVPDDAEIAAIAAGGVRPVVAVLTEAVGEKRAIWNKQDTVRHDTAALGAALKSLYSGEQRY